MSETSNGMPDLSAGDNEPSMEDILASIRKIIADDKTDSHALESETEQLLSPDLGDAAESTSESTSFSDRVDEQQFEIPEIEGTSQEIQDLLPELSEAVEETPEFEDEEILDLINFAENEVIEEEVALEGIEDAALEEVTPDPIDELVADFEPATETTESAFDESLDLVMESDASDYYTESAESDENRLLREEIENDLSLDTPSFEPLASDSLEDDLVSIDEDLPTAPDFDDLLDASIEAPADVLSLEDEDDNVDDVFSDFEAPEANIELDEADIEETGIEAEFASEELETPIESVNLSDEAASAGEDQDMDLVKSLLADLMDDDETDEFEEDATEALDEQSFEDITSDEEEADNILDEILYQSMEDETAISNADDGDADSDESELAQIARNARQAAAAPYQASDTVNPSDNVQLPERSLDKRFNLSAAGGFVGVAAGAALTGASSTNEPDPIEEQVSQIVEEELELAEIEELLDMIEETEAAKSEESHVDAEQEAIEAIVEELETPQESEKMGRAAKNEALLDENIEQDSSEAFAALSHVVQEKAEMEENGPAIGDLVQDALRPMLKEWLDKNLKGIVERAVTKEVKRISSGK